MNEPDVVAKILVRASFIIWSVVDTLETNLFSFEVHLLSKI